MNGRNASASLLKDESASLDTYIERNIAPEDRAAPDFRENWPFLRIPPFPGAKVRRFASAHASGDARADFLSLVREARVGGTYWAAQPQLPDRYTLVYCKAPIVDLTVDGPVVWWTVERLSLTAPPLLVIGQADPWHMLKGATSLIVAAACDELCLIAALLNVPVRSCDTLSGELRDLPQLSEQGMRCQISGWDFVNPYTGEAMSARDAVELCSFWRRLIDGNRDIVGGLGFAFWKLDHVAPLLWNGSDQFRFFRTARDLPSGAIAVWRSKLSSESIAALESAGAQLIEVEDGFLRSQGLGADCVPPLSITVDRSGAYFDPGQPSGLELLLENERFDHGTLLRASNLRDQILTAGLGKYDRAPAAPVRRTAGDRLHILVPGQVEDDRAVLCGGCGLVTNLELLTRVRQSRPDAHIVYKPHPDVVAGHRKGEIRRSECLRLANEIVTDVPISSLIAMADEVHVNTSLAGFEALLRGKPVTTYGVPFYAGWGLTRDLGPVPTRRTARRTVEDLVAATLLIYPRYFDPLTGLPCPAEVVVQRLSNPSYERPSPLVILRRFQGRLMSAFRKMAR